VNFPLRLLHLYSDTNTHQVLGDLSADGGIAGKIILQGETSWSAAQTKLDQEVWDGILLGSFFGGKDALEWIPALRRIVPHASLIAILAQSSHILEEEIVEAGLDDMLCMDHLDADELLRTLLFACSRVQKTRQPQLKATKENREAFLESINQKYRAGIFSKPDHYALLMLRIGQDEQGANWSPELKDELLDSLAQVCFANLKPEQWMGRITANQLAIIVPLIEGKTHPLRTIQYNLPKVFGHIPLFRKGGFRCEWSLVPDVSVYTNANSCLGAALESFYRLGVAPVGKAEPLQWAARNLYLEYELEKALSEQQFEAFFQPIISSVSSRVVGFESLVRWNHPREGLLSPDLYIGKLEEMGLDVELGEWMVGRSLLCAMEAQVLGFPLEKIAVNFTARHLKSPSLKEQIRVLLDQYPGLGSILEIEITERMELGKSVQALENIALLRELGVRTSLDDFGTGFSSFQSLRELPVSTIKIDRSFISALPHDEFSKAVVETLIKLARDFEIKCVAEGVEREEQRMFLKGHKCDELQGYLFAPALNKIKFLKYLQNDSNITKN